jgi:hypothetical protein
VTILALASFMVGRPGTAGPRDVVAGHLGSVGEADVTQMVWVGVNEDVADLAIYDRNEDDRDDPPVAHRWRAWDTPSIS